MIRKERFIKDFIVFEGETEVNENENNIISLMKI